MFENFVNFHILVNISDRKLWEFWNISDVWNLRKISNFVENWFEIFNKIKFRVSITYETYDNFKKYGILLNFLFENFNFKKSNLGRLAEKLKCQTETEEMESVLNQGINVLEKHAQIIQFFEPTLNDFVKDYEQEMNISTAEEEQDFSEEEEKTDITQMINVVGDGIFKEISYYNSQTAERQLKSAARAELSQSFDRIDKQFPEQSALYPKKQIYQTSLNISDVGPTLKNTNFSTPPDSHLETLSNEPTSSTHNVKKRKVAVINPVAQSPKKKRLDAQDIDDNDQYFNLADYLFNWNYDL